MNFARSTSQLNASDLAPLICFSHLRWDFVLQRPQHLMRRFAKQRRVFFFEEHIPTDHHLPYLEFHYFDDSDVVAVRPRVPRDWKDEQLLSTLSKLLDQLLAIHATAKPLLWFYTPMMFPIAAHVEASATIYDCMDELSQFRFAPPELTANEAALMDRADVVFTGGYSIYEAKRHRHHNIHAFPSSVDIDHFQQARTRQAAPADQAAIPRPILGYYGVIDERIDLKLIAGIAAARPRWSIVMVGPTAKIDPGDLPMARNIHHLGRKEYAELPAYLAGWDVSVMPFALNEATRFISPTKTPEYLAAGRPVVSTPVADVVRHYGDLDGVFIADGSSAFLHACDSALALANNDRNWQQIVDQRLAGTSWDATFGQMSALVDKAIRSKGHGLSNVVAMPSVKRPAGRQPFDYLIVGAGFAGSVLAERLASSGKRVFLCDRRPHIAGNTYDVHDEAGILVHKYGPHIFHTNSEEIFAYLSRFTQWRPYEHRVLAAVGDKRVPIPINRTTLNALYDLDLQDDAASRGVPQVASRTGRGNPDISRCRCLAGRHGSLPHFLRGLHAQAVGIGPVTVGQVGHRACPDPHLHR